ncbi:aldehyde dehydrogenase family-domain-containing protein [Fusarium oxysporum Fo47]|uniref:aldehyde dehydrogenase family-domain-containing protein n=1 Tax=Fusarium oxysporum Fo47 TaxID=660027 RepID=UPI002869BED9|nr:aldehyde dehydrogenase family-domain-containing protein [Fusarium oxysporum Fo47]WJG35067.1 aldehyde dehydrogenase family-domain-containing protein [Fusarium oxysporum Fo47]
MPDSPIEAAWRFQTLESIDRFISSDNVSAQLSLQNYVSNGFDTSLTANYVDSINPKTGKSFARVPISSAAQVDHALQAATDAFKTWSRTTAAFRSSLLQRVAFLIEENKELLAVWESIDQGKTVARARVEVDRAATNFRYFATFILHQENAVRMIDGVALTYEHRSPTGVFALISPWNMPLYLLTWKIAPCLAFGCTAVAKPSEFTSMSAFLLCEIFRLAEIPPGVINIVFGDGATTGSRLVQSPLVKGVSFTGSTATGIKIRRDTADQIYKHISLELGGKNPTLVFDDVDLDKAVQTAATAAFENQGEICLCGSRIYVQSRIYDAFVASLKAYVEENYRCGDRTGAVASLQHYRKIVSYLALAKEENATFITGSVPPLEPSNGYWIEPVVLTDVGTSSRIIQEEIFGPVVTIARFETEEECVQLANDSAYGLAAILLTKDGARMRRVGEQLDAGLVWVNCWLVRELSTPFGGIKNSGTGREGGNYSRDVFTVCPNVAIYQVSTNQFDPPVSNFCLYDGKDFILQVVGGPNTRNDFHGKTPHSPVRTADTVGLVMEMVRPSDILECLRWYCAKGNHSEPTLIHEESFYVSDLGKQLLDPIERWRRDEKRRTCPKCGKVEDPRYYN